ncbi:tetratricopeptide repeat protein 16 [Enhydra lutris kenyoni]|uniref:Tetratricopeptide repeat protein 16 n=1 Tax=Enhydra lutris kenyoni TaxID=391180 RepID=A0A2Y9J657_ENHLU|nr:tetratricopeptide repeat protein 16 [Enhydra lutris kenyoni]
MTNSAEDALELDPAPSKPISKPWVFPVPKGALQRIFGSSQVFQNLDVVKPKITGLTVPLKVREYYHQGLQCLEKEDWEMAVLFFSRALHLDSELVDFYALRAEAYIQLCDFSSAAQNLRRVYSFQPENTKYLERLTLVLYLQGQCLFEQCAFQEALRVFSHASALQPGKASFRYRCMACLLALEQYQDCLSLVTEEVKLGTTNADVFILRARLYNFFQKPGLCYQDLHSALLLDPKHPQAKALLQMMVDQAQQARQDAGILAVQGKLQHALQCINCAIENNPLDPGLFLFRGTMYRRLQEFDAAVEDFLKALDMMSESQERAVQQAQRQLLLTYNDFAVHCYLQGAYQEGVLLLNKALKDEQQEKGLYINRGDCFFQLDNLLFAEADYQQALALSPRDEGANLRMGLLQEKMGFCEQRGRQFHKAESHFSMAIQHNPQKAQYYLYRARSRQLLQNILGARLDVATVLLLNPKQPKLLTLMASLFPGMSVEDVLCSQVAHLARLQLDRVLEQRSLQAGIPQGIVGQLRERELERQKARALQFWWKPLFGISEELEAAPQTLTGEPAGAKAAEALHEEEESDHSPSCPVFTSPPAARPLLGPLKSSKLPAFLPELRCWPRGPPTASNFPTFLLPQEEKQEPAAGRVRSPSEGYPDQTSSGSVFGFRTMSISETSTICKEYRSTSATAVTSSDSSLLKTQSSDLLENNREHLSLSNSPQNTKVAQGQSQSPSRTKVTQSQNQSPSRTKVTQSQSQNPSKTESTQGQSQRPSKTKATQGQGRSSKRTKVTQGQSQSSSQTEATRSPRQKPNKTKATQGPRQRLRKIKAAHSWRGGLIRSSSRTKDFYDPSWSPSNTEATQDQCQRSSKTTAAQSWSQNTSPGYSKTEDTWGLNPTLRKPQTRGPEPEPQKNQDWPSSDTDP